MQRVFRGNGGEDDHSNWMQLDDQSLIPSSEAQIFPCAMGTRNPVTGDKAARAQS